MGSLGEDGLTLLPALVSCFLGVSTEAHLWGHSPWLLRVWEGIGGLTWLPLFPAGLREAVQEGLDVPCDH